jgi:hypothetical protein
MAAPALENLFKFNKKYITVKQRLETKIVEKTYANVAAGFLKKTKSRQATAAATAKPARPPKEDSATWTAPVSQLAAGSGSLTPVAF